MLMKLTSLLLFCFFYSNLCPQRNLHVATYPFHPSELTLQVHYSKHQTIIISYRQASFSKLFIFWPNCKILSCFFFVFLSNVNFVCLTSDVFRFRGQVQAGFWVTWFLGDLDLITLIYGPGKRDSVRLETITYFQCYTNKNSLILLYFTELYTCIPVYIYNMSLVQISHK